MSTNASHNSKTLKTILQNKEATEYCPEFQQFPMWKLFILSY